MINCKGHSSQWPKSSTLPASTERQAAIINLSACDPSMISPMFCPRGTEQNILLSRRSPEGFPALEMCIMSSLCKAESQVEAGQGYCLASRRKAVVVLLVIHYIKKYIQVAFTFCVY